MARLQEHYRQSVVSALMEEFEHPNRMAVPRLQKIVVNMGLGRAKDDIKVLDRAMAQLRLITAQQPVVARAKSAIAGFKLREGMPIGCYVTLRGIRMYEFFDRLVNLALPRVRDFRGLSQKSFDGTGNYTLGVDDQLIFPEIDPSKIDEFLGMNITIVTSAQIDEESWRLLELMGMPFRKT